MTTPTGRLIEDRGGETWDGKAWPKRVRCLVVLSLCVLLSCCGAARQAIEEEAEPAAVDPTPVSLNGALADCRSTFPDQIAQAEARASCVIKATELARPLLPFPELLDRVNALRKALAGQVQARTMSLVERKSIYQIGV
ncbi:hypothetical protein [Bradyrhizobium septentrionale]|uniref:Uncharacterized protein n=1 Tax=Bradyrhizobium septentrionale TaxID=1404411 RepID=A0ABZ2NR66_9BRAD